MRRKNFNKIYLISDSTGELGERFTNALISQFPNDRIVIKKFNFVADESDAKKVIGSLADGKGILFHTVLPKELKKRISSLAKQKNIPCFDLTGPPTDFLIKHLEVEPVWDVTKIHPIDAEYERRVGAIEFTINHDDGAGASNLARADAVLIGPSRSSKTPTSMYLAVKGVRVANIPLVREVDMSERFEKLKADPRVFGFVITPVKLCEMRQKRVAELGTDPGKYTDLKEIQREIIWSRQIYEKYRWNTIDVTDRAIEETAALILRQLKRRTGQ